MVNARSGRAQSPWESFCLEDCHTLAPGCRLLCYAAQRYGLYSVMYLERLKRVLSTERGLHLEFTSGDSKESIELSREAADQTLRALEVVTSEGSDKDPLTLTVLGHQVVRTPEAYGLLVRTQELGDVVFSLPPAILQRLITDLRHLSSSAPALQAARPREATPARGKIGSRPT